MLNQSWEKLTDLCTLWGLSLINFRVFFNLCLDVEGTTKEHHKTSGFTELVAFSKHILSGYRTLCLCSLSLPAQAHSGIQQCSILPLHDGRQLQVWSWGMTERPFVWLGQNPWVRECTGQVQWEGFIQEFTSAVWPGRCIRNKWT